MKNVNAKKLIISALPFIIFFYVADKAGQALRLSLGSDISQKVLNIKSGFAIAFMNPLPSIHPQDLLVGVIGAAVIFLMLQMKKQNAKKYRRGIEYGSARWSA